MQTLQILHFHECQVAASTENLWFQTFQNAFAKVICKSNEESTFAHSERTTIGVSLHFFSVVFHFNCHFVEILCSIFIGLLIVQFLFVIRISRIKLKLSKVDDIVALDSAVASDIHQLMEHNSDPFYSLFYTEQLKMQQQHRNGRRFHPDIIR